jgi:hypothetical protein
VCNRILGFDCSISQVGDRDFAMLWIHARKTKYLSVTNDRRNPLTPPSMHTIRAIYEGAGTIVGSVLGMAMPALAALRVRALMLDADYARLDGTVAALKAGLQLAIAARSVACSDTANARDLSRHHNWAQFAQALRRVEESELMSHHEELNEAVSDARRHLRALFDLIHKMASGFCDDQIVLNFRKACADVEDQVVFLDSACRQMGKRSRMDAAESPHGKRAGVWENLLP